MQKVRDYFPDKQWEWIQSNLIVFCTDVLFVKPVDDEWLYGLILRNCPDGRQWCLIGGRQYFSESTHESVSRHVTSTLGNSVRFKVQKLDDHLIPLWYTEYKKVERSSLDAGQQDQAFDPRKHAAANIYGVDYVSGKTVSIGESFDFNWFSESDIIKLDIGFNQKPSVLGAIRQYRLRKTLSITKQA